MKDRKIFCLNNISELGLEKFRSGYEITDTIEEAAGVLVRSADIKNMEFPPELADIATSIGNECEKPVSRSRLIAEISNQLEALYGELETGEFMAESRARSNVIGRDVTVIRGSERFDAHAVDIDDAGRLVIRTAEGVSRVGSGEISLKLK
jgi:biotin-(acetyl-CoA carboxylase) ligase